MAHRTLSVKIGGTTVQIVETESQRLPVKVKPHEDITIDIPIILKGATIASTSHDNLVNMVLPVVEHELRVVLKHTVVTEA